MGSGVGAERDYSLDNIRFFLIFTVVFGHLLEICGDFPGRWRIYQVIYTFHMPVFLFLFGCNIKFAPRRIVYRWCVPYVVFQCIYIAFSRFVLKVALPLQFTTPYWLLWYMLACICYQVLLKLYDTESRFRQILALVCTFAISLMVGFLDGVGYGLSLSRLFVFQPWFLLGYYCKKNGILNPVPARGKLRLGIFIGSAVMIALSVPLLCYGKIPTVFLYGSLSYAFSGGKLWMRGAVWCISLCWILFLFVGIRPYINRPFFGITRIGQNSWPVFLLHGFFVKMIPMYLPGLVRTPWHVLLLTGAMLALLGNPVCGKVVNVVSGSWLENLFHPANPRKTG